MAYINCKKCGCQMSDKSEACPMCGTPVGADVEEINKTSVEEQPKPVNPVPNEQLMDTKGETAHAPAENNASTTTPPPPIMPSDKPAKKSNKTPIIIGIAAAVVVIGALAAFLLLRNPRTNEFETQIMAEAPIETIEEYADPCLTVLNQLYNNYVFGNQLDQFGQVVDDLFTNKGKQKLLDAYDYECETGDCYGIWALRTMAQDGDGESKIIDILQIGDGKYTVKYLDMGAMGETIVTFAEENGKMKIDDFRTIFDESYDENIRYMKSDDQLLVPNWVIGKWEYDKNEVIEFTPTKFIYTVNGEVVEEGPYDADGDIIYLQGESDACQIGYVMMNDVLYFEGGDNVPLKKLSEETGSAAKGLTKEYEWLLGEWKGVDFKGDLAIISRDGIVFNNAVRSALLDEMEPDRSELNKQPYEIKKTTYDFDHNDYMSIVVSDNAEYYLDLKSKTIFYFYDFDQKIILKKVK